jgi:hypothetical protein
MRVGTYGNSRRDRIRKDCTNGKREVETGRGARKKNVNILARH